MEAALLRVLGWSAKLLPFVGHWVAGLIAREIEVEAQPRLGGYVTLANGVGGSGMVRAWIGVRITNHTAAKRLIGARLALRRSRWKWWRVTVFEVPMTGENEEALNVPLEQASVREVDVKAISIDGNPPIPRRVEVVLALTLAGTIRNLEKSLVLLR